MGADEKDKPSEKDQETVALIVKPDELYSREEREKEKRKEEEKKEPEKKEPPNEEEKEEEVKEEETELTPFIIGLSLIYIIVGTTIGVGINAAIIALEYFFIYKTGAGWFCWTLMIIHMVLVVLSLLLVWLNFFLKIKSGKIKRRTD